MDMAGITGRIIAHLVRRLLPLMQHDVGKIAASAALPRVGALNRFWYQSQSRLAARMI